MAKLRAGIRARDRIGSTGRHRAIMAVAAACSMLASGAGCSGGGSPVTAGSGGSGATGSGRSGATGSGGASGSSGGGSGGTTGGGSGGSNGPSVSLEQACSDRAASECDKLQTCTPRDFEIFFADHATCVARLRLPCPIIAAAPGSGYDGKSVEACAKALAATSCADYINNVGPAACRIRGTSPLGAPCASDAQCAGAENHCKTKGGVCGICAPRVGLAAGGEPSEFGSCYDKDYCQDGLICPLASCAAPLAAGTTCDLVHPCQWPSQCVSGTCAMPTLAAGAACDVYLDGCDPNQRLACVGETNTGVCTVLPIAGLGETCGLMGNLGTGCRDGNICDVLAGSDLGKCQPPLADGAPCDNPETVYDRCQPPASCTGGVCKLLDPAVCVAAPDGGAH